MRAARIAFTVALAFGLAGCGSREAPETPVVSRAPLPAAQTCPIPAGFAAGLDEIVSLTNAFRADSGTAALGKNARLAQAAQAHACDMAALGQFSHTGSGGSSVTDRVEAAGYDWGFAAENIAYGLPFAAGVFDSWKGSTGHRRNMLNPRASQIGLGVAANPSGQLYWVMVLGKPR